MRHQIVFGSPNDYLKVAYKDLEKLEGTEYLEGILQGYNTLIRKFHTAHCCTKFAVKHKLPFRKSWFKLYYGAKYRAGDEYLFVFLYNWYPIFGNGYIEYLRKHYPGCKCVLYLQDINCAKALDIQWVKRTFDHVMIFERNFANAHGIDYYPLIYSDYRKEAEGSDRPIDVLFVGWAKGRYSVLKKIYDRLVNQGVNCQFYLSKLDEDIPFDEGIHPIKWMPYCENRELIKKAKCLLDIIPSDTDCNTMRVSEAISHNCRILTNNVNIDKEPFFSDSNVSIYASPDDIDVAFCKQPYENVNYGDYINSISPQALFQYLDRVLYS